MLIIDKKFFPFFVCQLFGVINDSVLRLCLVAMLSYGILKSDSSGLYIHLAAALFMLPFFAFSAMAGVLADSLDKKKMLVATKAAELAIMLVVAVALHIPSLPLLLVCLFLTGVQSTFFGPLKFSLLPILLEKKELISGNAWFGISTFVAILLGTVLGTIAGGDERYLLAATIGFVVVAAVGLLAALFVKIPTVTNSNSPDANPPPPANESDSQTAAADSANVTLAQRAHPWRALRAVLGIIHGDKRIHSITLAASLFWLVGILLLNELPQLGQENYQFMLGVVVLATAAGAALCRLGLRAQITNRYALLALAIAAGALLLAAATYDVENKESLGALFIAAVFAVAASLTFYVIPLRTSMQVLADENIRARVISGYNIYNSGFIVAGTIVAFMIHAFLPPSQNATVVVWGVAACGLAAARLLLRRPSQQWL